MIIGAQISKRDCCLIAKAKIQLTMDHISLCAELHRCLTTQDEQEIVQISKLVQDKKDLSATYLSIHNRSLVDSVIFYLPRGHIQLLMTLVWSMNIAARVRTIHASITNNLNPPALIDAIILSPTVSDSVGNNEWHTICKEYSTTYKAQLPAMLNVALSKIPSLWAKLCLLWIESQKIKTNDPESDASKLLTALRTGDMDTIAFIIGTADPGTWMFTLNAFERQAGNTLMSVFDSSLKRHDLVACQLASQALLGQSEAAAYLIHRAVKDYGDHDRFIRVTAFCYDRVKRIDDHYQKYGNIRSDLKRVFRDPVARACAALWDLLPL